MIFLLPTDTCYGLAGEFTQSDYLEIYRLKGRDFAKPLALLVEDFEDMKKYIEISDEQIEFLKRYPHPWSFLGKRISDLPEWMDSEQYKMLSIRVASVCLKNPPSEKSLPRACSWGELEGVSQKEIPSRVTPPNLPLSGEE